jgi:hypothetical protein
MLSPHRPGQHLSPAAFALHPHRRRAAASFSRAPTRARLRRPSPNRARVSTHARARPALKIRATLRKLPDQPRRSGQLTATCPDLEARGIGGPAAATFERRRPPPALGAQSMTGPLSPRVQSKRPTPALLCTRGDDTRGGRHPWTRHPPRRPPAVATGCRARPHPAAGRARRSERRLCGCRARAAPPPDAPAGAGVAYAGAEQIGRETPQPEERERPMCQASGDDGTRAV